MLGLLQTARANNAGEGGNGTATETARKAEAVDKRWTEQIVQGDKGTGRIS